MNSIQREIAREVLRFCKRRRICIRCRKARAVRGKSKCADCRENERLTQPARLRRKYRRLDRAGLCVRCGQYPQQATNKRCERCEQRHQATKNKARARRQLHP